MEEPVDGALGVVVTGVEGGGHWGRRRSCEVTGGHRGFNNFGF